MIIGAGSVGRVAAFKCAGNAEVFGKIVLASRRRSRCDEIAGAVKHRLTVDIQTEQVDANHVGQLTVLFKKHRPDIVINLALPYQDLSIMKACLECRAHYLDTANYEPPEKAKFEYKWQWDYQDRFKEAGLMALLGCGFDPGVTNAFTKRAADCHFDEIHYLDIVDCNAGEHGKAFATNFNPEINIREIMQKGKYWENGRWVYFEPFEISKTFTYPKIGRRNSYLIYHEELESLVKNFPTLKRARFWMTFSKEYLTYLNVISNIGMTGIEPIIFEGKKIVPLQFLKAVLPDPGKLGENYKGKTSIGCRIRGIKEGKEKTYYTWNNCSHEAAFKETGAQAVSYTAGVPAMAGAYMMLTGRWKGSGVFNVEEFDSAPFLKKLENSGLPWHEAHDVDLEIDAHDTLPVFCP